MSRPVVVSDSGPLIALAGCGQLELLVAVFVQAHAQVNADRDDAVYATAVGH